MKELFEKAILEALKNEKFVTARGTDYKQYIINQITDAVIKSHPTPSMSIEEPRLEFPSEAETRKAIDDFNKQPWAVHHPDYDSGTGRFKDAPLTIEEAKDRVVKLEALINNPELNNFLEGVKIESAHQTERWGAHNEENNPPHHYTMVINKLLGKLCIAIWDRDVEKFKHHCITIAAAMHNCHRQIDKAGTWIHKWFYKDGK